MDSLKIKAEALRTACESGFSEETRCPGWGSKPPSTGHCAVMSILANEFFKWDIVTAKVKAGGHWFNRIAIGDELWYIDTTADQLAKDMPKVLIAKKLPGYYFTKPRKYSYPLTPKILSRVEKMRAKMVGDPIGMMVT